MKTNLQTRLAATLSAAAALWLTAGGDVAQAATALNLTDNGIVLDSGADAKYTLGYPLLVNAAKKNVKIQNKTVDGRKATLTYEGGGQAELTLGDGEFTVALSDVPADTKMVYATLILPTADGMGVKWAVTGAGAVGFPQDKPPKAFLYQGHANAFELTSPAGAKTALQLPEYSYQQLQDNREWNGNAFQWQIWVPYNPDNPRYVVKVGDAAAPAAAAATTAAAPATPAVPVKVTPAPTPAAADAPPGPEVGATKILKWKDGKRAVFMLEFDDSCESHIKNAIPELKKRGMVGTFYINPGNGPYKNKQSAWEKDVPAAGMELGNHTFKHNGALTVAEFEQELTLCTDVINKAYPDRKQPRLISYGPPGVPKEKWGITPAEMKPVVAKLNLIERPSFFGPPLTLKTKEAILSIVDQTLAKGEMGHLDFHGVGGDWHVTPMDWFIPLLDRLDANRDLWWVADPISWHKYLTERKAAEVKTLAADAKLIRVQLSCTANPALYDLPLTLATRVPPEWKNCQVTQGTTKTTATITDGVARYSALPGAAEIVLQAK